MTRSKLLKAVLVLAVVAVVTAALLIWRATPFGPTEEPGSVRDLEAAAYGTTYEVMLPSGRLKLVVGPATSSLSGRLVDGFSGTDDVQAARGDSLLPVSWNLDGQVATVPVDDAEPFSLEVVTGGEHYDLGADEPPQGEPTDHTVASRDVVVAVAGDAEPDDTFIEVTYDGQTQTVDLGTQEVEAGLAATLYDQRTYVPAGRCGQRPGAGSGFVPTFVGCDIGSVILTPYRPGVGWVDGPDETWALVRVELDAPLLERLGPNGDLDYDKPAEDSVQRILLDGDEPDGGELTATTPGYASLSGELVFRVAGDPEVLRIERDLRLRAGYAEDEPTKRVRLVQDLRLEPA